MAWTEHLPSGRYRAVYRTPDGRRRGAGVYDRKRDAAAAAEVAERDAARLSWRSIDRGQITVDEWHDRWWPTRRIERSTRAVDTGRWATHVGPRWGSTPLEQVSRFEVKEWAGRLHESGLSLATVQRCVALLSASLAAAVDDGLLDANPAARLRLALPDTHRERYLTRSEGAALLGAVDHRDRAIIAFLLGTGCRWGEAAGATVQDYDVDAGTYRVRQTHDSHSGTMKAYPKGRRLRTVPVPDWVAAELRPIVGTRRSGLLFRNTRGGPVDYSNWRERSFAPALRATGIEDVSIHTLRHTFASWLIQDGVPLAEVGRLLGHRSPVTTQRYAHLLDDISAEVRAALRDPRSERPTRTRRSLA